MSTIPPTPPPVPATAPAAGGGTATVVTTVGTVPEAVTALPAGAQIEVVALSRALKGMVEVLADGRPMTLKLPADLTALPGGSRMVLQVYQSGGETQFRLLSLNGRPVLPGGVPLVPTPANLPAPVVGGQPGAVPAQAGSTPAATPAPTAPSPAPGGITATVLRPAPAGTTAPPAAAGLPADLPPGTQLTVRIAGTAPPPPTTGIPPTTATPTAPSPPAAPSPASMPAAPAPLPATTTAPPAAHAHPAAAQPGTPSQMPAPTPAPAPAAPTAAPGTVSPPPVLTGTVIAHPPGGNAVVRTPAATLSLPMPAGLPVGSRVTLEVIGRPELPPLAAAATSKPEGLTAAGWPALDDAVTILARTDAQAAELLLRAIPQANARMAASMAMFASALRSGDPRQVLADAVTRGLERAGKRDTADRLKGDVEKLSADSARPLAGGEWRAYTMPFLGGAQIEPIRLYVRHDPEDEQGGRRRGRGDDERFVLEVAMTRLGRVQLDGLVRRTDKQFDLIVRTERPLPQDMRRDIAAIFAENAEVCGTSGMVSFQAARFVELPPPETQAATMISV